MKWYGGDEQNSGNQAQFRLPADGEVLAGHLSQVGAAEGLHSKPYQPQYTDRDEQKRDECKPRVMLETVALEQDQQEHINERQHYEKHHERATLLCCTHESLQVEVAKLPD